MYKAEHKIWGLWGFALLLAVEKLWQDKGLWVLFHE